MWVDTTKKCWCGGRVGGELLAGEPVCLDSVYHVWDSTGDPGPATKLYVAGPMSGVRDNNYPLFNSVAEMLREEGYDVVNPAEYGEAGHYIDLIREDLRLMLDCKGVAVLDNWWLSGGARNEVAVAGFLRMPVRPVAEWISRADIELGTLQERETHGHKQ